MKLFFLLSIVSCFGISFFSSLLYVVPGFHLASWARLFYFCVLGVNLQKLLDKLPINIGIWGTLQKAIFLHYLFINCYTK